jgi:hypothetical protein
MQTHIDDNVPGMMVSASRSNDGDEQGPWAYEIHPPAGSGIDVEATPGVTGNTSEQEIMFPGGIASRYIRSAQQYDEWDNPIGEPLMNPNFRRTDV